MQPSKIEWTESTWNPITGCTKISSGCKNCYAERMAARLQSMGVENYRNGFESVTCHKHVLNKPLSWKKPQIIFVNSMSDMFHENVPFEFIQKIFAVMRQAHWHTFQVLTKRGKRLEELAPEIDWPANVWMGVTVEDADCTDRIDCLRKTNAAVKFLSMEPLLTAVPDINLDKIDWVIVGGESGPNARLILEEWILDILVQCQNAKVPFFFKQWGGLIKKQQEENCKAKLGMKCPKQNLKRLVHLNVCANKLYL